VRFSTRGVQKQKHHKKLFGEIHVKNFWPKKLRKKTIFLSSFPMAFLCVSQQGEFKNTIKNVLGEVHVKNFWPKKLREKKFCRIFPSIFFIAFLAVSLHEEPKNTIKIFSKIRPENRKKSQKKMGR
jgi:hypothetical protein